MSNQQKSPSIAKAEEFLTTARAGQDVAGQKEQPVRDIFTSYLPSIFPERPYWVKRHIDTSERKIISKRDGRRTSIFVDNLVNSTAIEYETDLRQRKRFETGLSQVKEYCAGLLNEGANPDWVTGVLSDTLEWHIYAVTLSEEAIPGEVEPSQVILDEIDSLNLHEPVNREGQILISFLGRHLGRQETRSLSAENIAKDLGLKSVFYSNRIERLIEIVQQAFDENPEYSQIVINLWENFVAYLDPDESEFNLSTYVAEFYITTLAKLLCANTLVGKAVNSSKEEIISILRGDFFVNFQIDNMVEHDYFGWLLNDTYLSEISSIASEMQGDLLAYSYAEIPENKDLFGPLMVQLADQTRRILLGQEWTPHWLAQKMANNLLYRLPDNTSPRFIDPCCGSGAFISAVLESSKTEGTVRNAEQDKYFENLKQTIIGFDIDPVAVMLSKITWLLSVKEFLPNISTPFSIPVYHADSLFLVTPLIEEPNEDSIIPTELDIDGQRIELPKIILQAENQTLFDDLIERAYTTAVKASNFAKENGASNHDLDFTDLLDHYSSLDILSTLNEQKRKVIAEFASLLSLRFADLDFQGRNGIWAFVIRNSYRPILMTGNFNGVISNPPWLAMSKLGNNPYKQSTEEMAIEYEIKPTGSSFPHLELSTLFIMHSIIHYLSVVGYFAFVVPLTVLNGHQHNPFRVKTGPTASSRTKITEIWEVGKDTFKNRAAVIFGERSENPSVSSKLPGKLITKNRQSIQSWFWNQLGNRSIWSTEELDDETINYDFYDFQQGADILPRRFFFVEEIQSKGNKTKIKSIENGSSWDFAVKDAKSPYDEFSLQGQTWISKEFIFLTLLSKHLSPFFIAAQRAIKTIAPIKRDAGVWRQLENREFVLLERGASAIFTQIKRGLQQIGGNNGRHDIWNDRLNIRNKLVKQVFPQDGYLVFTGAGGKILCSAYLDLTTIDTTKILIDQTLYWTVVNSVDEAKYLVGLFNSKAINELIVDFVPKGKFGGRHQHTLPFVVTPEYDPENPTHQNVVTATSSLLIELEARIDKLNETENKTVGLGIFDPSIYLSSRRRKIREFIQSQLNTYDEYEQACRLLYRLPN